MSCDDDAAWLDERIAATKALIVAHETALLALAGGSQMYTIDTGQTRQTVQKSDMGSLRNTLDMLENRLSTLTARKCGGGTHMTPGF